MTEALTHFLTVLFFVLIAYLLPASKGGFSPVAFQEFKILEKQFRFKEGYLGLLSVLIIFVFAATFSFFFLYCNNLLSFLFNSSLYFFTPEYPTWFAITVPLGFAFAFSIQEKVSRFFIKDRAQKLQLYLKSSLYYNHRIDPVRFEKYWRKFWFILSLIALFFLINWNLEIKETEVKYRPAFNLRTHKYNFNDIDVIAVFNIKNSVTGRNRIEKIVHFTDGNSWKPLQGLKSGSDVDSAFSFLSLKTGIPILLKDSIEFN